MIAILDAELTWTVVPVAADGSAEEQKIVAAMAASLNGLYGEQAARVLLSGVRGVKYVRLFHEAYGDLHGTDGELLKPPPDPPGTIH